MIVVLSEDKEMSFEYAAYLPTEASPVPPRGGLHGPHERLMGRVVVVTGRTNG